MTSLRFSEAIDAAVAQAMESSPQVIVFGEDVPMIRRRLVARFGRERVKPTPISESAFLGAAVGAALGGLKPVVEVQLVDFLAVGLSALLNEAAKVDTFSNGSWTVPMVVRATCGGGYGDGGQHEQALWGLLAGIPGLSVVVPSNPADAAGLMLTAIEHPGPLIFLEHKLLSHEWLEWMGGSRRDTVTFDVPSAGAKGDVPMPIVPVPLGKSARRRDGDDLTLISLGVGLHRCIEAADLLDADGISCSVVDLRTVSPLDADSVVSAVNQTGRVVVVDEDYTAGGLSGEIAALLAEKSVPCRFARVTTETTIPYCRSLEFDVLPNTQRVLAAARHLLGEGSATSS